LIEINAMGKNLYPYYNTAGRLGWVQSWGAPETWGFGGRYAVVYATIVAKMSRNHEIEFATAIGLAAFAILGLSLLP
jgi:hypothetical protein